MHPHCTHSHANTSPPTHMPDDRRLIDVAFPLEQASLDSVHEKNVRHGHISTLHIWPARRPLAAARAALLATLLPDPGDDDARRKLVRDIGGDIEKTTTRSGNEKKKTTGGVLRWKHEDHPRMDDFREQIKKHFGGRAPKVLDPFAGGGAIPLEAMRLGCDVTAIDLNPVAWFILKCTLDYPQKLSGETRPLPDFATENPDFMDTYFKKKTDLTRTQRQKKMQTVQQGLFDDDLEGDLSWHVRAWGHWVLDEARKELAEYYPTYAHFETTEKEPIRKSDELKRVPVDENGVPNVDRLNADFIDSYLEDETNPRWVAKPTVAYLWARTVPCKGCRATLPLLKTQKLSWKKGKRIRLVIQPKDDGSGVTFDIERNLSKDTADEKLSGTMSRTGAQCPCCQTIMKTEDIRQEGKDGNLGQRMTAVVVNGQNGKEYRLPTESEIEAAEQAENAVERIYAEIPFGELDEPVPEGGSGASRAFSVKRYGIESWGDLYTPRQLVALGTLVKGVRNLPETMRSSEYSGEWKEAVSGMLALAIDRVANSNSMLTHWEHGSEFGVNTFQRYALSINYDFCEEVVTGDTSGCFVNQIDWVARVIENTLAAANGSAEVLQESATSDLPDGYDVVVTDPPYYDAIPYSDAMDFFYVWLRRTLHGLSNEIDGVFSESTAPKWDHDKGDGELIHDANRFDGDKDQSKQAYEEGMTRAFQSCSDSLKDDGYLVLVFANKDPDAWETLVSSVIKAGFVVEASWPIETERSARTRAHSSAALSSSIWLVCRKRPSDARPGWDEAVLEEMRDNITKRLRQFWDAGIRGPDFVWAATGPGLEAYSKHPVVKKSDADGTMDVAEFLEHVRREVVDFAVGRVFSKGGADADSEGLDSVTAYYLLHRHDYGHDKVPSGAAILYALSCGLDDKKLTGTYDLLAPERGDVRLKEWSDRNRVQRPPRGDGPVPLIDHVHRLMVKWDAGDREAVDTYASDHGLSQHELFNQVLQAMITLADGEEEKLLERVYNYLGKVTDSDRESQAEYIQAEAFDS